MDTLSSNKLKQYSDNFVKLSGMEVAHVNIHVKPPGSNLGKTFLTYIFE